MRKQPLLILCICFILGIIVRDYWAVDLKTAYIIFVSSSLTLISFFSTSIPILKLRTYFICLFFFTLGLLLHSIYSKNTILPQLNQKEELIFKVDKKLNSNERNRRYEILIYNENSELKSVLSVPRSLPEFDFRHYYQAELFINRVQHPKNDYQFDYAKYLNRKGIYFQSYLPGSYRIAERKYVGWNDYIRQKRMDVLQRIDRTAISAKSREFLKGIILADRTEMDRETVSDFTKTGLVHILAISGSHIVIIFGIFFWLLVKIFPVGFRKYAIICSLILIWIFAVFIGYGNSVVRSCIMISVYFIYVLLQRKPDLLHSMALAAFIILLADTHQIFDVGFQLSFLAVFGIYWLNQPILKYFPKQDNFFKRILFNTFSISLAAQISTLPAVLYYFHQFSMISILANLIIIPLSEFIIVFSLFMTLVIGFGFNSSLLSVVYDSFIKLVLQLIHWFSTFDRFLLQNVPMSLAEVAIMCAGIYFLRFLIKEFDLRNMLRVAFIILIYFGLHIGLTLYEQRQNEVMIHHHFREKYFSVKETEHITFWIRKDADIVKVKKYIIDPYLTSKRAKEFDLKILPAGTTTINYGGKQYFIVE
ncbi:MAG: ComEC family competence protein [Weeksellaceae bacterium]|nr:ComEC family competence protein [Weeksellaceae bacterium]